MVKKMKLYLTTNERKIGVVLADDKSIYFKKCFNAVDTIPNSSLLQGIKRGVVLSKNLIKPTNLEIITENNYHLSKSGKRMILNDAFLQKQSNLKFSEKKEDDDKYFQICKNMVKFEEMREYNDKYNKRQY